MAQRIIKVDEQNNHVRLDVFLAQSVLELPSRTYVRKFIDEGHVLVNHKQVKAHHKVVTGDEVVIDFPEVEESLKNIDPEEIPLDIFYEDENVLIVNKPVGMLVHPVPGRRSGTLVNALLHYSHSLSDVNSFVRPGIVHRLDRETSGLIVVAKDNRTHVQLARQFEKHKVRKRYVALVKGDIEFDEGVIDAPLGRHARHWEKKQISFDEQAKEAKTFYRVLKRFEEKVTMVALFPQSGRTHQLRVHMAYLGHPILGDDKYGIKGHFPRMGLHAQSLGFKHPRTKNFVEFSTPIPAEFMNPAFISGSV